MRLCGSNKTLKLLVLIHDADLCQASVIAVEPGRPAHTDVHRP